MACQSVTNGYKCGKGVITFTSPTVPTNPLTSHVWTVDGIEESTASQFNKTYAVPGTHTVSHTGANACGAGCSSNLILEIVDVVDPEPTPTASAPKGVSPLAIAAVVTLGVLGIVMLKKKK